MPVQKGVKLRFAIDLLVIMTLFCTIIVSWYIAAKALKSTLTNNYLENNYTYAYKLSLSTGDLLNHIQLTIQDIGKEVVHREITQLQLDERASSHRDYFNSLFIVDPKGVIQLSSSSPIEFDKKLQAGTKIQTEIIKKALALRKPSISKPYISTSGQLIMLISTPIFDQAGKYQGLVAGTIHLESNENIFNRLLSKKKNADGSYVCVIDSSGHIIYHPDSSRINEDISESELMKKIKTQENGSVQIVNNEGNEMFAGYAYDQNTGWRIVSETPISVIENPLHDLLKKMIVQSLPLLLIILFIARILTNSLTKPINQLAKFSEEAIKQKKTAVPINRLKIKSHIYEVHQLNQQIYDHFQLLNNQIQLDGLTGIANRKTFDLEIKDLIQCKIPFTLIMIDIDRFKKVNDTYGHLVGDDVLKYLSRKIEDYSEGNLCFRYGGEEFGILVKNKNEEEAFKIAEQLRKKVAETISPTGEPITISLGIASIKDEDQHPEEIIKRADCALFQSKVEGRNRTTIYNGTCESLHQ